ncbi:hypothetical protein [Pseudooctadecabacter sp.]
MIGLLFLVGALASALLASRLIDAQSDRRAVEAALVRIPVDASKGRRGR